MLFAILCVLLASSGVTAALVLLNTQREYRLARNEYDDLRALLGSETTTPAPLVTAELKRTVVAINPDYVGWMRIDGTRVDYPVVQGTDNKRYLNLTFSGECSAAGTIFVDRKCEGAFSSPLAVVHGHNMKDGSMFASLHGYRDEAYLKKHPTITVITPQGEVLAYRVFAVRLTNTADTLFALPGKGQSNMDKYFAEYEVPEGAEHFLALSTCTKGGSKDERLLVFAAR
ncbi:MAG: sortase [Coriobacteriia bacterium]|nr:sortase [Coriobacteriia bacterium]